MDVEAGITQGAEASALAKKEEYGGGLRQTINAVPGEFGVRVVKTYSKTTGRLLYEEQAMANTAGDIAKKQREAAHGEYLGAKNLSLGWKYINENIELSGTNPQQAIKNINKMLLEGGFGGVSFSAEQTAALQTILDKIVEQSVLTQNIESGKVALQTVPFEQSAELQQKQAELKLKGGGNIEEAIGLYEQSKSSIQSELNYYKNLTNPSFEDQTKILDLQNELLDIDEKIAGVKKQQTEETEAQVDALKEQNDLLKSQEIQKIETLVKGGALDISNIPDISGIVKDLSRYIKDPYEMTRELTNLGIKNYSTAMSKQQYIEQINIDVTGGDVDSITDKINARIGEMAAGIF